MPKPSTKGHTDAHIQRARSYLLRWGYGAAAGGLAGSGHTQRQLLEAFLALKGRDMAAIEGNDVQA